MTDKEQIKEQIEFTQWLKDNGIYNQFASAYEMRFGHSVWKACKNKEVK